MCQLRAADGFSGGVGVQPGPFGKSAEAWDDNDVLTLKERMSSCRVDQHDQRTVLNELSVRLKSAREHKEEAEGIIQKLKTDCSSRALTEQELSFIRREQILPSGFYRNEAIAIYKCSREFSRRRTDDLRAEKDKEIEDKMRAGIVNLLEKCKSVKFSYEEDLFLQRAEPSNQAAASAALACQKDYILNLEHKKEQAEEDEQKQCLAILPQDCQAAIRLTDEWDAAESADKQIENARKLARGGVTQEACEALDGLSSKAEKNRLALVSCYRSLAGQSEERVVSLRDSVLQRAGSMQDIVSSAGKDSEDAGCGPR